MSITLPTGFGAELLGGKPQIVMVFELELAAGTLYYSDQAIASWGGNAYTALVTSWSPVIQQLGGRLPECRVKFSNATRVLRPHLTPDDLITNRRMVIRRLLRDTATGNLLAGSVVELIGIMQRPRRLDEESIEITVLGLGRTALGTIPPRNLARWCGVHEFADAVDCNYTSTTTTTAGGTGAVIPVADAQKFRDELDRNGIVSTVFVGDDTGLSLDDASVGGATITVGTSITYANTETVGFEQCPDRTFAACQARARTHEYQGFRGGDSVKAGNVARLIEITRRIRNILPIGGIWTSGSGGGFTGPPRDRPSPEDVALAMFPPEALDDHGAVLPIIYGRRLVSGVRIEEVTTEWTEGSADIQVTFFAVCEGEIDSVVDMYVDGEPWDDVVDENIKKFGIFYRAGGIGLEATETQAEYTDPGGDATTRVRDQNRDALSEVNDPLSRTAYVTLVQKFDGDVVEVSDPVFDVKGIKVQEYDAAGSPVGAAAFSRNPVWQLVDLLTNKRYGLGRFITTSDIDFAVADDTADHCDDVIDGPVATVSGGLDSGDSSNKTYLVGNGEIADFTRGMTVEYDDGTVQTSAEIVDVTHPNKIELDQALYDDTADTITAKLPRYTCDVVIDNASTPEAAIGLILDTFNGYITYDAAGLIQIRAYRSVAASVAHFKDTGATAGYEIVDASFDWLTDSGLPNPQVNRVFARYTDQDNISDEAMAFDESHVEVYGVRRSTVALPGVDNRDVAYRIAKLDLDRRRVLDDGAIFDIGPIGLELQPGDLIEVTHDDSSWSGAFKRVLRKEALSGNEEMLYRITVEDYDANIHGAETPARYIRPNSVSLSLTLAVDQLANGRVVLTWGFGSGRVPVRAYSLHKSTATFSGALPDLDTRIGFWTSRTGRSLVGRFEYTPLDSEQTSTLYFVVVGYLFPRGRKISNEVTALASDTDPTAGTGPFWNMLWGGDFHGETNTTTWKHPNWVLLEGSGTETEVLATGSLASPDNWTDVANAHDGDGDNFAVVTPGSGINVNEVIYTFAAGTKSGRFQAELQALGDYRKHSIYAYFSTDAGANYTVIGSGNSNSGRFTISGPLVSSITMADARLKIQFNSAKGGQTGRCFKAAFQEQTYSAPFSIITGDVLYMISDGATQATASRPFPGPSPDEQQQVFSDGGEAVAFIQARAASTVSVDPTIVLIDDSTGTEWELASIPAADITSTWRYWTFLFTAPTEISGALTLEIRSGLGTVGIEFDKAGVYPGDSVPTEWWPHISELHTSNFGDRSTGRPTGFQRGDWSGYTSGRRSEVSGDSR